MATTNASIVAQVQPVTPNSGFPGGTLFGNLLSYGMYLALGLSVASILYGAGSWTWSSWGNAGAATNGRKWLTGGVFGALLSGLAVGIVNKLFQAGGAGI